MMKSSMKENGINCKEEENITGDSPIVREHNLSKTIVICRDINLDLIKYPSYKFTKNLTNLGFIQLVNASTHIMGSIIDHVHFYSPQHTKCTLYKLHPLYYSYHDAVTFLLNMSKVVRIHKYAIQKRL